MSDFFESKYQRPVFSPVIKITKSREKPAFVSEIGGKAYENMFEEAENVKKMMKDAGLTLMKTAQILGIDGCEVANKLRLLEFSEAERAAVINNGCSERQALCFLQLSKKTRLYAMEYCRQEGFDEKQVEEYVNRVINEEHGEHREIKRTFEVSDIGFLINSLKKTLHLADKMGFDTQLEKREDEDFHLISIKVRKRC